MDGSTGTAIKLFNVIRTAGTKLQQIQGELGPGTPDQVNEVVELLLDAETYYMQSGMPTSIFPEVGPGGSVAS